MHTAVIILNYNNYYDTINCIKSIEEYNTALVKYIIVDNGSSQKDVISDLNNYFLENFKDNYRLFSYEEDSPVKTLSYVSFVVSKNNSGYAQGNNKGLEYAYADEEIDKGAEHASVRNGVVAHGGIYGNLRSGGPAGPVG